MIESTPAPSDEPGNTVSRGNARTFPCEQCGADLKFTIGVQTLQCPSCQHVKQLEIDDDAEVAEQDLMAMLTSQQDHRSKRGSAEQSSQEVRCDSCGATVVFEGTLTSTDCAYCGSPIQLETAHTGSDHQRVPVDAVLPFRVEERQAGTALTSWVSSRWFAPNDFKQKGGQGKFAGVYLPFWTYDAMTHSRYHGERGDDYSDTETYTDSDGETQTRTVTRTSWHHVSGRVQRFFDDLLVCATEGVPHKIVDKLEPWHLEKCLPFTKQALAGFQARTYDIDLRTGFSLARDRMDRQIERDVRYDIGGDHQRIHDIDTRYNALTYKHILLPLWLLSYRYKERIYQVVVNAQTGEVQGERPYSWIKITLAVLTGIAVAGGIAWIVQASGG